MKRRRKSIFNNKKLIFNIPSKGDINPETRKWTYSIERRLTVEGDLQPFVKAGKEQVVIHETFKLSDSKMFITNKDLPQVDDVSGRFGAYTTINGRNYFVVKKYDFSGDNLTTDAYFYILAIKKVESG